MQCATSSADWRKWRVNIQSENCRPLQLVLSSTNGRTKNDRPYSFPTFVRPAGSLLFLLKAGRPAVWVGSSLAYKTTDGRPLSFISLLCFSSVSLRLLVINCMYACIMHINNKYIPQSCLKPEREIKNRKLYFSCVESSTIFLILKN